MGKELRGKVADGTGKDMGDPERGESRDERRKQIYWI